MAEFKLSPHAYTTGLYNNKLNQKFSELIKITHKLIRKHSLKTFNNRLKYHDYDTIESVLAHAEHSASYNFFMKKLQPLHDFLPKHLKRRIYKWQSIHSFLPMELMGTA